MKKFRIDTSDFILYMDAKSILDALLKISFKYGEHFVSTITAIIEM